MAKLKFYGKYYDEALKKEVHYHGIRYHFGLLGIGSAALKFLAMNLGINLSFKISTATSNFMIGVAAATSSGVYWALEIINTIIVGVTISAFLLDLI